MTYRDLEVTLLYDTNRCTPVTGPSPWDWFISEIWLSDTNQIDFNQSGFTIGNGTGNFHPVYGIKLINCVVHDNLQGLGLSRKYYGKYVYGCIIYYNGWHNAAENHGHGFYMEHEGPDQDYAIDNLSFYNFAEGAQNYGSSCTYADRGTWDGNAFWMNGHMGGAKQGNFIVGTPEGTPPSEGSQIIHNMTYTYLNANACGSDFDLGYGGGMQNGIVQSNYLGSSCQFVGSFTRMTIANNTFAGGTLFDTYRWSSNTFVAVGFSDGWPEIGVPTGTNIFIRTNLYEEGRANIVIYNWDKRDYVNVDLSMVGLTNGTQYELHQANDYFNDVLINLYNTNMVSICMTNHSAATPIGQYAPTETFPTFGAFVIRKHKTQ